MSIISITEVESDPQCTEKKVDARAYREVHLNVKKYHAGHAYFHGYLQIKPIKSYVDVGCLLFIV